MRRHLISAQAHRISNMRKLITALALVLMYTQVNSKAEIDNHMGEMEVQMECAQAQACSLSQMNISITSLNSKIHLR